jgi:hypothetical protein
MSGVGYRLVLQQKTLKPKTRRNKKMATAKIAEKATSNTKPKKASNKKATPAVAVELTAEGKKALADFRDAKKAEALAKEQKELAELALREALGDHKEGLVEGMVVVKVVNGKNTHFDRELMKEIYPEAYQATLRETLYDYLRTL